MWARLIGDEAGATAIEYGLIAALIALAAVIAFQQLGLTLEGVFNTINAAMSGGSA
ncbi:Flp family type IVb pilin [Porphyrobacter sp. CACIAM 03H1]|uniref:Flp family type IVb pilin n=1 Tax=Porphyrobacter sp. CACIAM 03H1 TaxID=2003315 RepID=UPI000B5A3093|nr:Flp family type IVb pilin [Porphyrobacter sp. CACIAM 03H1]ASJ91500.1 Flp family type IVb pilin [Porphyrobacter sp. CACIAM 03H1]